MSYGHHTSEKLANRDRVIAGRQMQPEIVARKAPMRRQIGHSKPSGRARSVVPLTVCSAARAASTEPPKGTVARARPSVLPLLAPPVPAP